jgi:peptidoglycan hydrolase CwlO-like protein
MDLMEKIRAMKKDPRIELTTEEVKKFKQEIEAARRRITGNAEWMQKQFDKVYGKKGK